MKNAVALVDCNNFYASCERAFNPAIWYRPVAVLSNNDGCIIARSEEVKILGIKLGTPYFKCQDLLRKHNVAVFSSNYALYGDISQRVMELLRDFTPELEIYSIDEAFLSLTGFERQGLENYAREIRKRVLTWIGIPTTIGIASTKTLAKIATSIAKKDKSSKGVLDLTKMSSVEMDEILKQIPVGKIWGIGRQSENKLHEQGISSAFGFKYAEPKWIKKQFKVVGLRTQRELWGESCLIFDEIPNSKKQIICSRSFGRPVTSLDDLKEAVAEYASQAAYKLRKQNSSTKIVQVYITTNRFNQEPQYTNAIQMTFPVATSNSLEIAHFAGHCVERIFKSGYRYKKAGVILLDIVPESETQLDVFWKSQTRNSGDLMKSMDLINEKFGAGSIRIASEGISKPWRMRRENKSPHFTTCWNEIPVVKAG